MTPIVRWHIESQKVEVWDGDEHFLLHPYLEVEGIWSKADYEIKAKGYSLPTTAQLLAMHRNKREIDKVILAHYGSMLKGDSWHWTRVRTDDYAYEVVYMHNGLCRTLHDTGKYIGRAVLNNWT